MKLISEVQVFKYKPWELPPLSAQTAENLQWFFFCPRSTKPRRSIKGGQWKATGNDRDVKHSSLTVGKIKTLIYYNRCSKNKRLERTNWVMRKYRLDNKTIAELGICNANYVICKVFEKSGLGRPTTSDEYGARFIEDNWNTKLDVQIESTATKSNNATETIATNVNQCNTPPINFDCGVQNHNNSMTNNETAIYYNACTSKESIATDDVNNYIASSSNHFIPMDDVNNYIAGISNHFIAMDDVNNYIAGSSNHFIPEDNDYLQFMADSFWL
ncbi:NAC domain-containing protein 82-like [Spinacia oleracea]|uniref:NAC domain-containing protein 82-like n=1 Tax=Spinacia oleracea TaxID=3562 RepID=A0A9R0HV27_SPIOL|nr:NAC domain-containing protein 82-like [Spinacia oleracea]